MGKVKRLTAKDAAVVLNSSINTGRVYTRKEIQEIFFKFLSRNTIAAQNCFRYALKEKIFTKVVSSKGGYGYIPTGFPVFYERIEHWYEISDKVIHNYQKKKVQNELQALYKQKEEIENKIKQYLIAHKML